MRALLALLLMLMMIVAVPARAAAPLPAPPASAEVRQRLALVDLVLPMETLVSANVAAWRASLDERFDKDAALVTRERAEPGLRAAMIDAGLKEVETTYRSAITELRRQAYVIYASGLTPKDTEDLVTFFQTPTGRKLVSAMHQGIAASDKLTPDGMRGDGKRNVAASIDESDRPALEKFAKTEAFKKAGQVSPRIADISNRQIMAITERLVESVPVIWDRMAGKNAAQN